MFALAIVQNRNLARLLQALALSGVLIPLATAQGAGPRLPIAKQTKPAPPEVRVPVGEGAIPPPAVIVSDTETPRELPVPAAGALRKISPPGNAIPPQGYATQAAAPNAIPADNRYTAPRAQQTPAANPLPGFSAPRSTSVLGPKSPATETLEPITEHQEPMPTPAGQEEAPLSLEAHGIGETISPLPPKRTTASNSAGEPRSILSSSSSTRPAAPATAPPAVPVLSEATTGNSQAEEAAPRYAPTDRNSDPMPTPVAEPYSATPYEAPASQTPLVAEAQEATVPAAAPVANEAPLEDPPVPFAPIPVPVPKTAAVPSTTPKLEAAPATFRDVEPGVTTLEQLIAAWGEPIEQKGEAGAMALLYKIDPFSAVQIRTESNVVESILIRLDGSLAPEPLAERLQLDLVRTVEVRDERGQPMGRAFPERGVLFGYDPTADTPVVAQVLLETIDPQAFYLRAETYWRSQAAASLDDLNYVVAQTPGDAVAQHLAARIYLSLGQVDVALEAVDQARELDPEEND
jgi:hypothetical protein